jgi:hypothetical protein
MPVSKGHSPHFIPLTQGDLDHGLSEEQIAQLSKALNVKRLFKELYQLSLQADVELESQRIESGEVA